MRTRALFTVKQGDEFQKVFYNKLSVKVYHELDVKLEKCLKDNSVICVDADKNVLVKGNVVDCKPAIVAQLQQKLEDDGQLSEYDSFYKILKINSKEALSKDFIKDKYEKK